MNIEKVNCYAVSAEDQPGEAARFSGILKEDNVDLAGIWAFSVGEGKAQFIVVPKDAKKFEQTAEQSGITVQESYCFHITGNDKVGALADMLSRVASEGINLHALDAIVVDGEFGCYLWSDEADVEKVAELLKA